MANNDTNSLFINDMQRAIKLLIVNMIDKQSYIMTRAQLRFWTRMINDEAMAHQSYTGYHQVKFPYTDIPRVYSRNFCITPLGAMFVLGREHMFVHHFDEILPLELKFLRKLPSSTKTVWSWLWQHDTIKCTDLVKKLYVPVFCRLHYFFSAVGGQRTLKNLSYPFKDFTTGTYMDYYKQLSIFYQARHTDSRSLKTRLYLPVLTLRDIPQARLNPFLTFLKTFPDTRLYKAVVKQLYNSSNFNLRKSWDLRKYAEQKLTRYMVQLHDCSVRVRRRSVYAQVNSKCMYLLNRTDHIKSITAIADTDHLIYDIEAGGQKYSCVVSNTYETAHAAWLFIRFNTRFTKGQSHPYLYNLVRKFNGRVPRLSFHSAYYSDGIMLPWEQVRQFFPQVPAGTQEHDITHYFKVHRLLHTQRVNRKCPTTPSPYLTLSQLCTFDHEYLTWTEAKRKLFCRMFFENGLGDHILNTEAQANFVVKVLTKLEYRRNMHNLMNFSFWERFTRLQDRFSERLHVMFLLGVTPTAPLALLFEAQHNWTPSKIGHFLAVAHMYDIQLSAFMPNVRTPEIFRQARILHCIANLPGTLRRVIWQTSLSLPWYDAGRNYEPIRLPEPVATPNTNIPVYEPEPCITFHVNRQTGCIEDFKALSVYEPVVLMFKDEPGQGQGVYKDILSTVWKKALEKKLVTWQDNTLFINTAATFNPNTCQQLQHLGFISALSIYRGFYLPFPLHKCWWTHIVQGANKSMSTQAFEPIIRQYLQMLAPMNDGEVADVLGLPLTSVQGASREQLIEKHYIPDITFFYNFCLGFSLVFQNPETLLKLGSWPGIDLNRVLVDPKPHIMSPQAFEQCFHLQHCHDTVFLEFVETLNVTQLSQLVHFITGKRRLPLVQIGEPLMSVTWAQRGGLPYSHNCTNTLSLNRRFCSSVHEIQKFCQVIFDYDTVYGLA